MAGRLALSISQGDFHLFWQRIARHRYILGVTVLAGVLRLGRLGATNINPGLRNDEPFTMRLIQQDFVQIIYLTSQDVHPPLYYFLARAWGLAVGMSIPRLRVLAVVFGTLSVPLLYLVARRLVSKRAALASAALLATSTFHIFQSQKARMYSLLLFFALVSTYYYLSLIEKGDRKTVLLYVTATVAMAYTHVFAFFVVLFHGIDFVIRLGANPDSNDFRQFALSLIGVGVLTSPWLLVFINQVGSRAGDFWIPEPTPYLVIWSAGIGYAGTYSIALLFGVAFVSISFGLINRRTSIRDIQIPALWAVIPSVVPLVLSLVIAPIFIARYTIPALPGIFILVAFGVSLRRESFQLIIYSLLTALICINLWIYYAESRLGPWILT